MPIKIKPIILVLTLHILLTSWVFAQGEMNKTGQLAYDMIERKSLSSNSILNNLQFAGADINVVLEEITAKTGVVFIPDDDINGEVTVYLNDIYVEDALRIILDSIDLAYKEEPEGIRVMTAKNFKLRYGYAFNQLIHTKIIPLLHADLDDTVVKLQEVKSSIGKILQNKETNTIILMDSPNKLQEMVNIIQQIDLPIDTKIFTLQHIRAVDIEDDIRKMLTPQDGIMSIDSEKNEVVVTDTLTNITEIENMIERIDQKERNVLIKTKIINITLNDEYLDGVDWEGIVSNYVRIDLDDSQEPDEGQTNQLSVGSLSKEDLEVLFDALDTVGTINTSSEAKIETKVEKTVQLPVKSTEIISTANIDEDETALEWDEELKFNVSVRYLDDQMVQVKIKPRIISAYEESSNGGSGMGEAVIKMEKNSTIVIGGIFKEVIVEATRKIPLLGDLPIVGFVFRNEKERLLKTEVIIFITPEISEEN
ncbi:MAG: hypothetical protein KC618_01740 [Candidatus Omnitrophica bacterium]|nr:hypothetical protein [Candidatus Omnitrophota bacterium]